MLCQRANPASILAWVLKECSCSLFLFYRMYGFVFAGRTKHSVNQVYEKLAACGLFPVQSIFSQAVNLFLLASYGSILFFHRPVYFLCCGNGKSGKRFIVYCTKIVCLFAINNYFIRVYGNAFLWRTYHPFAAIFQVNRPTAL